eukprot:jgi/Botrbrau1/12775/Bobra.0238s0013.1
MTYFLNLQAAFGRLLPILGGLRPPIMWTYCPLVLHYEAIGEIPALPLAPKGYDGKTLNFQVLPSHKTEGILSQLDTPRHRFILEQLPFIATHGGAVSREILDLTTSNVVNGMSFAGSSKVIKEIQTLKHYRSHLAYLQCIEASVGQAKGTLVPCIIPKLPYGEIGGRHKLYAPSPAYLASQYLKHGEDRREFSKIFLGDISGRVWRLDWTFRDTKYIRDSSGQRVFKAVFTIMNEFGELVLQLFTVTADNFDEIQSALHQLRLHIEEHSLQMPEYVYVDNVTKFEGAIQSAFPTVEVKQDVAHVIARYLKAVPDSHCLKGMFAGALSDSMLKRNVQDERQILKHFKDKGVNPLDIRSKPRNWWKKRARYTIPKPAVLAQRVQRALDDFRGKEDPEWGPLVTPELETVHANQMMLITQGYLSDPEMDMYINVNRNAAGVPKLITVRGTSKLEAYHRHLHEVLDGANNSPEMANALILEFNFRWTMKAGINMTFPKTAIATHWKIRMYSCACLWMSNSPWGSQMSPTTPSDRLEVEALGGAHRCCAVGTISDQDVQLCMSVDEQLSMGVRMSPVTPLDVLEVEALRGAHRCSAVGTISGLGSNPISTAGQSGQAGPAHGGNAMLRPRCQQLAVGVRVSPTTPADGSDMAARLSPQEICVGETRAQQLPIGVHLTQRTQTGHAEPERRHKFPCSAPLSMPDYHNPKGTSMERAPPFPLQTPDVQPATVSHSVPNVSPAHTGPNTHGPTTKVGKSPSCAVAEVVHVKGRRLKVGSKRSKHSNRKLAPIECFGPVKSAAEVKKF